MATLLQKSQEILAQKTNYITPNNLKAGVTAFGVNGTFSSNANVLATDIINGKVAYANGSEIVGTMNNLGDLSITPNLAGGTYNSGFYNSININAVNAINLEPNLTANNIANGVNMFGIIGTLNEGINTADANAIASGIYNGQTAYVNGVKLTGTCTWTDELAGGSFAELEALTNNILGVDPYAKYRNISNVDDRTDLIINDLINGDLNASEVDLNLSIAYDINFKDWELGNMGGWNFSVLDGDNSPIFFTDRKYSYVEEATVMNVMLRNINNSEYYYNYQRIDGMIMETGQGYNSIKPWYYSTGGWSNRTYYITEAQFNTRLSEVNDYLTNSVNWTINFDNSYYRIYQDSRFKITANIKSNL